MWDGENDTIQLISMNRYLHMKAHNFRKEQNAKLSSDDSDGSQVAFQPMTCMQPKPTHMWLVHYTDGVLPTDSAFTSR